jgi:hypothetical protein
VGPVGFFSVGPVLQAVHLDTSVILWRWTPEDGLLTAPVVAGRYVFVASENGKTFALDVYDGTLLWSGHAGGRIHPMRPRLGQIERNLVNAAPGDSECLRSDVRCFLMVLGASGGVCEDRAGIGVVDLLKARPWVICHS